MPARKRPAPEDAVTARQIMLEGLARDADIFELLSELAPLHPRDNTFPGEVVGPPPDDLIEQVIRAAASRADAPVRQTCQDLAQSPGRPVP